MVKVSIKTFTGVRAKERKKMLAKLGYDLSKIKGVNEICAVKKYAKIV
jgi:NACalpha-BTF3-like transcription factor